MLQSHCYRQQRRHLHRAAKRRPTNANKLAEAGKMDQRRTRGLSVEGREAYSMSNFGQMLFHPASTDKLPLTPQIVE